MIEKIVPVFVVCLLGIYMFYAIIFERPVEQEHNYADLQMECLEIGTQIGAVEQKLNIYGSDRFIDRVSIYLENRLEDGDFVNIILLANGVGEKQIITLSRTNFSSGWYQLPFQYDNIEDSATLIFDTGGSLLNGTLGVGFTKVDLLNTGECLVEGINGRGTVAIQADVTVKNSIWDQWYIILIIGYSIIALGIVLWLDKNDDKVRSGRIAFVVAIILDFICLLILDPYFLSASHTAENSLNFYYLTSKHTVIDALFKADAGYLPLLQRLIAVFFIKILNLGTAALYYMQFAGIMIDCILLSVFNLYTFRSKLWASMRFVLSLSMFLLFVHPLTSTYFNFVYMGYFLIAVCLINDLNELKNWQYTLICIVSAVICMSKGFFAVMLPVGIMELLLFSSVAGKRKNIYAVVLVLSSGIEIGYAFGIGAAASKYFDLGHMMHFNYGIAMGILLILVVIVMLGMLFLRCWARMTADFKRNSMNVILLFALFIGSFMIGTVAFRYIALRNLFDWGTAWYVPATIAMILLLEEVSGITCNRDRRFMERSISIVSIGMLVLVISCSFVLTRNKLDYSYHCVSWDVYRNYFDKTIVPVFREDERFGTLQDGYTFWYTNHQPVDNYEYGAPYEFRHLNIDLENMEYISKFDIGSHIGECGISAVYLNYISDIGNVALQLIAYDEKGNCIKVLDQNSPLSSKTVGFLSDEPIYGASYFEVKSIEGQRAYVENNVYIAAK